MNQALNFIVPDTTANAITSDATASDTSDASALNTAEVSILNNELNHSGSNFNGSNPKSSNSTVLQPNVVHTPAIDCNLRYQRLIDAMPQIVLIADATGAVTYLNQKWTEATGLTLAASLGWQLFERIHPQERDRVQQQWRHAVQTQQPLEVQLRLLRANDRYSMFTLNASPVQTGDPAAPEWIGTFTALSTEQAETALQKERELHSVITKNMAEGICLVRLCDGLIVYANPKFERMFGYELGELSGKPVAILNYEDEQTNPADTYRTIADWVLQYNEIAYEVQNIRKDGTVFWCEATTAIFEHPEHGAVLVAVQQDVTDRRKAKQALRDSEQRFRAIFDQSFQFMSLLKPDGTVVEVNQTMLDFAGLTSAAVIDRPFWETHWWALRPDTQTQLQTAIARAAEGRFVRYEVEAVGVDDITATLDLSIKPIRDSYNRITLLIVEGRDVTLRKNAEAKIHQLNAELEDQVARRTAQLAASKQQYETLTRISPVGIFRTDEVGACVYVNDRWCQIAELTPDAAAGFGWARTIHPDDQQRLIREWHRALHENVPFNAEYRFQRTDGSVSWVVGQAIVEVDDDGRTVGFVGTVTDITDRKQAELALQARATELAQLNTLLETTAAKLKERNRELDQFAYVASHDLKAPLRAIANLSEWIEEDLQGQLPPENQRQMQLMRGRVQRMEALINGLLQFSRVGRVATPSEVVVVEQLLAEVIDSLDPPATVTINVASAMPTFAARGLLLRQVFANLISNAIKHHDRPDGTITITAQDQNTHYEFAVADDGPGIAAEYHDRIFVIFQTLAARDSKENTGIGLSIVKKIVETEGGKIWLESTVGHGSTFRFTWQKQPQLATEP